MGDLVHLAGPPIRAANVIRQRCAWCGALLDEKDLDRIAMRVGDPPLVDEDGKPTGGWVGLVGVSTNADGSFVAMWAVPEPDDEKIPKDSCMALDPAVTT
jgi:hypothetical protein